MNWFPHFTVKGVSLITCGCFALLHRLLLFLQHWCDHIIERDYSKLYSFKNKANIGLAVEVLPYFYPLSKLGIEMSLFHQSITEKLQSPPTKYELKQNILEISDRKSTLAQKVFHHMLFSAFISLEFS